MRSAFCGLACLFLFISVPAIASFQDNSDGTVTDSETGLIWQKISGTETKNWQEALAGCASLTLGGQSDWRLPSRNELQSIVDYRQYNPALDSSNPLEVINGDFWTSSTDVARPSSAYVVDFSDGVVSSKGKITSLYVIAVRGGVSPAPPETFFHDNQDGTVTDSRTGLVWLRAPLDLDNNAETDALTWQEALAETVALESAGFSDWRLPNRNELQSIVDYNWHQPAIDNRSFPKVISGDFWTSSTDVARPSSAYAVDFSDGMIWSKSKVESSQVLVVRSGISLTPLETFFHDNQDGTVTDSRTGLIWLRAPLDLDNNAATDALTWQEALAGAVGLESAGFNDWRLPNRNELQSIVDYHWHQPAVDNRSFPKVISGDFWTSSTDVASPSSAYAVDFSDGMIWSKSKVESSQVLVVRGQQDFCSADTDTDGDGIKDCHDTDDDNDDLLDIVENQGCTDALDADTDDDGILDGVEDADHNGVVNGGETDPCDIDSDNDGIQDGTELGYTVVDVAFDTDLSIFQPDLDPASTTDALKTDSDGDGIADGVEDSNHNGRVDAGETDPTIEQRFVPLPGILLLLLK